MEKKYLSELTYEEAEKLICNNASLRDDLYERTLDNAYSLIGDDWMYGFPYKYSISNWRSDYIDLPINDSQAYTKISNWLLSVQASFELFNEREYNIINRYLHNLKSFYDTDFETQEAEMKVFDCLAVAQYEAQQMMLSKMRCEIESADDLSALTDEFFFRLDCECYLEYYTDEELTHVYFDVPKRVIEAHTEQIM